MPDLPVRKVGIVACSGEEDALGTITRLAALRVLNDLRRGETVTICLPLFLAGGQGDRAFARLHPTITVDGCELQCGGTGDGRPRPGHPRLASDPGHAGLVPTRKEIGLRLIGRSTRTLLPDPRQPVRKL